MNRLIYISTLLLLIVGCYSKTETPVEKKNFNSNSTEVDSLVSDSVAFGDLTKAGIEKTEDKTNGLPIHGEMNQDLLDKYYPGLTDTINDLRIIGAERVDLSPGNGIIVSILHNTGTFDQMIVCTHDSMLNPIDNLYIGKARMFDKTSHTIEYNIVDKRTIRFDHVDWGYVKKEHKPEIDTVSSESYSISITEQGKISKTMSDKTYEQ